MIGWWKIFWSKHENKIITFFALVLTAVVSFEMGFLRGAKIETKPMVIEKVSGCGQAEVADQVKKSEKISEVKKDDKTKNTSNESSDDVKNCAFVGSKNSDKYHLPTCQWAKSIKPENLVCFQSVEEAVAKGYKPGCVE